MGEGLSSTCLSYLVMNIRTGSAILVESLTNIVIFENVVSSIQHKVYIAHSTGEIVLDAVCL